LLLAMRIQFFLLALIFAACSTNEPSENKEVKKTDSLPKVVKTDSVKPEVQEEKSDFVAFNSDNYFNNITAVISGLKGQAHELNYLFDTLAWKEHAQFIDESWSKLEKKRLAAMREWATSEFAEPNTKSRLVFYPFSGPDFLTAHAFFPSADKYIMLGLEPVGKLPDLGKFKKGEHSDYAQDFKRSLGDIFEKSYFITRKMLQDFGSQKVNGLLPVLTFFIRKTGHEISNIKYIVRYEQDSIVEVPYEFQDPEKKPFGVRVDYVQNGKNKSVYYFKYDVSDKKFNDTCVFYKYLSANKNHITYIKSASYLLHNNFMSNMRKMILDNSNYIIQDDTGIPYKYFTENNAWDMKLYGKYTRPVSDFPYLKMQQPLQEAFEKDSAKVGKLPFHLGYHWGSKKDVIIFASKR
jgi:hypothetical protein